MPARSFVEYYVVQNKDLIILFGRQISLKDFGKYVCYSGFST